MARNVKQRVILDFGMRNRLSTDLMRVSRQFKGLRDQARFFNRELQKVKLREISRKIGDFGRTLTTRLTLPLAVGFGLATRSFANFENSFAFFLARFPELTGEATKVYEKFLRDLAKRSVFTAKEVTEAAISLQRSGFNPNEIKKGLEPILNTAIAIREEIAPTATSVAQMLRISDLPIGHARRLGDYVTTVLTRSNVQNLEEFMDAYRYFAPSLGTTFSRNNLEGMFSLVGVLGDVAQSGSRAGTALRKFFLEIMTGNKKYLALLKFHQQRIKDATGIDIRELFEYEKDNKTGKILRGLDGEKKIRLRSEAGSIERLIRVMTVFSAGELRDAFGIRAFGALQKLVEPATLARFVKLKKTLFEDPISAAKVAQKLLDPLIGKKNILLATLEESSIKVFGEDGFGDRLGTLLTGLTELVRKFNELPSPIRQVIVSFGLLSAAAGPLLLSVAAFGKFTGVIGAVTVGLVGLKAILVSIGLTLSAIAGMWFFPWINDLLTGQTLSKDRVDKLKDQLDAEKTLKEKSLKQIEDLRTLRRMKLEEQSGPIQTPITPKQKDFFDKLLEGSEPKNQTSTKEIENLNYQIKKLTAKVAHQNIKIPKLEKKIEFTENLSASVLGGGPKVNLKKVDHSKDAEKAKNEKPMINLKPYLKDLEKYEFNVPRPELPDTKIKKPSEKPLSSRPVYLQIAPGLKTTVDDREVDLTAQRIFLGDLVEG